MSSHPEPSWYCPKCGHQNQLSFRFCTQCGTGLPEGAAISAAPTPPTPPKTRSAAKLVSLGCVGLLGLLFVASVIAAIYGSKTAQNRPSSSPTPTPVMSTAGYAPTPNTELVIVKSTWRAGGFGTVALWQVTLKNNTSKPIGNIQYRTAYYSETGNIVDKGGIDSPLDKKIIQKVIPPKSTRTIEVNDGFTHREAHRAGFELVKWEFVADQR